MFGWASPTFQLYEKKVTNILCNNIHTIHTNIITMSDGFSFIHCCNYEFEQKNCGCALSSASACKFAYRRGGARLDAFWHLVSGFISHGDDDLSGVSKVLGGGTHDGWRTYGRIQRGSLTLTSSSERQLNFFLQKIKVKQLTWWPQNEYYMKLLCWPGAIVLKTMDRG